MSDFHVKNEITGLWHPIAENVYFARMAYEEAKRTFEFFAKHQHNHTSLPSAYVYQDLMSAMDEARRRFLPFENAWCIAKKGYSLN
jgi:hypothetical protein